MYYCQTSNKAETRQALTLIAIADHMRKNQKRAVSINSYKKHL